MQTDRLSTDVVLPQPPLQIRYRLCFDQYFQNGRGRFDYLHFVRSRGLFTLPGYRQIEEAYWLDLERNRTDFASQLNESFDLLVDPPSNSGYHRPFLSAFGRRQLHVPCVHLTSRQSEHLRMPPKSDSSR